MSLRIVPDDNSSSTPSDVDDHGLADRVLTGLLPVTVGPPVWLRLLLAAAALFQIILALPWLVGADPLGLMGDASTSHLTRDGALGLIIGVAGLITAWRPRHATAAVLVGLVIVGAQLVTALVDDHYHRVSLLVEASHVSTLVITALVGFASRPARSFAAGVPVNPEPRATVRSVAHPSDD